MATNRVRAKDRWRNTTPTRTRRDITGVQAAGGGRQLKLHATEVFTERQNARPGPWKSFDSTRVTQARYDSGLSQIQVIFKDGTPWVYEEVPQQVWKNMRRTASAGKFINRVLNGFPYRPGGNFTASGEEEEWYAPSDF